MTDILGKDYLTREEAAVTGRRKEQPKLTPTALYRHFDANGVLLYVGVSLSAIERLRQHRDASHWSREIARVEIKWFLHRSDALNAEREAVRKENPKYNVQHRPQRIGPSPKGTGLSRQELTARLVRFEAMYEIGKAAEALNISAASIRRLIETGQLGYCEVATYTVRYGEKIKTMISGWHLIDYIESTMRSEKP